MPAIPAKVLQSRVLTGGKAKVRQTAAGIDISVARRDRQPIDTVVALELDTAANKIPAVDVPRPVPVSEKAKATASNIYQNQAEFAADKAVDGNGETRWATDAAVHQAWLELDLGRPTTFAHAWISEAFPNRVQKFELQWLDGGEWKTISSGTTIGESWWKSFDPVTAQRVRLNILEATDGPTIWEFQLFEIRRPAMLAVNPHVIGRALVTLALRRCGVFAYRRRRTRHAGEMQLRAAV